MTAKLTNSRPARRWGPGTAAIVRLLIAAPAPLTQVAIAHATGITQPRVSQVLKRLTAQQLVRSSPRGYSVTKPARLLDLYREHARPSLTTTEEPWYGAGPLFEQVRAVLNLARQQNVRMAFSADIGPDLLVPWRHPTLAIVYSAETIDLRAARLVRAEGRGEATLLLRATDDESLLQPFPPWPSEVDGVPITDPVQQWRDLIELGGVDRHEAADRLRRKILDRAILSAA